jgi:hypothetical protein
MWVDALESSSRRLRTFVEGLDEQQLLSPSFDDDWSVAQVLSHLGSAAEICTTLLERGAAGGTEGPAREDVAPIWNRWDALEALEQRDAWYRSDANHLRLLRYLAAEGDETLGIPYFAGPLTLVEYMGYRLSEQSVRAWDARVSYDPTVNLPADELALLWDRLHLVASRFNDGATREWLAPQRIQVNLVDTGRPTSLIFGSGLWLLTQSTPAPTAAVIGTAEAVPRLVYGRNRPGDEIALSGAVTLDDLRSLFPGY